MDEGTRQELLGKTEKALETDDWNAVEQLWQPWVERGDAEAEYQLAYHYLWCTPCDDDATCDRMKGLLIDAASKNHPDAIWFLATQSHYQENDPELARQILRAGELGSVNAQRSLGVLYATGDWSGPRDLAEAARWYRMAAEKGHAESQYDLGCMLLLGEGIPKDSAQGLMWLERAGELGEPKAFHVLVNCYSGYYDVPVDTSKAASWRARHEEYQHLHPVNPNRRYSIAGALSESLLEILGDIDGVTGAVFQSSDNHISVFYDAACITPAELDEKIRDAGISASPAD